MIERIKKALYESFNSEEKKGVFFSCFGKNKEMLFSQGVFHTDNTLADLIDSLYENYIETDLKDIAYIVCDVISDTIEVKDMDEAGKMSPKEYGFAVVDTDDDTSGVLLPNMEGVDDIASVIYDIKQKYGIHGQATIYAFRTIRTVLAK